MLVFKKKFTYWDNFVNGHIRFSRKMKKNSIFYEQKLRRNAEAKDMIKKSRNYSL